MRLAPRPVQACEAFWARKAGGDYPWTRAVPGHVDGEWHHCCPGGCGGGVTFTVLADGSLNARCRDGHCDEVSIVSTLLEGCVA